MKIQMQEFCVSTNEKTVFISQDNGEGGSDTIILHPWQIDMLHNCLVKAREEIQGFSEDES